MSTENGERVVGTGGAENTHEASGIAHERRRDAGFTLIELLVVIIILGILAAIIVFAIGGLTDTGQTSACEAEHHQVETAVEAYYAKHASYPANVAVLTVAPDRYLHSAPGHYDTDGSGNITGSCP